MSLTDKSVKAAKPKEKLYRLADERGLCLEVPTKGNKRWRFRYRFQDKAKMISLGSYPDISLREAREERERMRKLLAQSIDPSLSRKQEKESASQSNNFEALAREWFEKFKVKWTDNHAQTVISRLENNVFPWLGESPIDDIEPSDILPVLRRIEARGAIELAHRVRGIISQAFRYGVASGKAKRDPAADLQGALTPRTTQHFPTITDPREIADLLRLIDLYQGHFITRCALQLAPLVFVRPVELRKAEWAEIDFDTEEWRIPGEKMKRRTQHIVPLSKQAISILKEIYPFTGDGMYIFPSIRSSKRPMSENTINGALRRLGYTKEEMTCHGFRSMASTRLNELGWNPDAIERQLAHTEEDSVRAAYNHAEHLPERRKMMQTWADYLDSLKLDSCIK